MKKKAVVKKSVLDSMQFGKESISIRLDRDILTFFRSSGDRWQSRVNMVLREYMEANAPK